MAKARETLRKLRGDKKTPAVRLASTIGDGHSLIGRAVETLKKLDTKEFDEDATDAVNRAVGHLEIAADELKFATARTNKRRKH